MKYIVMLLMSYYNEANCLDQYQPHFYEKGSLINLQQAHKQKHESKKKRKLKRTKDNNCHNWQLALAIERQDIEQTEDAMKDSNAISKEEYKNHLKTVLNKIEELSPRSSGDEENIAILLHIQGLIETKLDSFDKITVTEI